MTGRDLILYILKNHLEDEPVWKDGRLTGFMTIDETAKKMNVGWETIFTYVKFGWLESIEVAGQYFIPATSEFKYKPENNNRKEKDNE